MNFKKIICVAASLALILSLSSCKKSNEDEPAAEPDVELVSEDLRHTPDDETFNVDNITTAGDFGGIKVLNSVNITGKSDEDGSGKEVSGVSGLVLYNGTDEALEYLDFSVIQNICLIL